MSPSSDLLTEETMLFNMGDWQVLVSLMGLFMSLWFVIGSCSDRKMISGHFSI